MLYILHFIHFRVFKFVSARKALNMEVYGFSVVYQRKSKVFVSFVYDTLNSLRSFITRWHFRYNKNENDALKLENFQRGN